MLIDLTNDAPMIEPSIDNPDGIHTISTIAPVEEFDEVTWTPDGGIPEEVPIVASAKSRTAVKGGATISEFMTNERDLLGPGTYVIKAWTRRGQARVYNLTVALGDDPSIEAVLTVQEGSTPSSWVCGDEVFTFKKDAVEIPVPYAQD